MILPGVAQEIADVIGRQHALYLIGQLRTCKGKNGAKQVILYVPKKLKADHRLVEILGMERAQKLVDAFGGENFVVPNCREIVRGFHHREMLRMHHEGLPNSMIAEIIEVSERTVRNVVRRAANDNQTTEIPTED